MDRPLPTQPETVKTSPEAPPAVKPKINWKAWEDGIPLPENPVTRAYLFRSCFGG